jgi:hypothetical protein
MKLSQFQQLTFDEKVHTIYDHGVYIGKRKGNGYTILLYQVAGFYVEVVYKKYRNVILNLESFDSTDLLQPYLDAIDLEAIVYTP